MAPVWAAGSAPAAQTTETGTMANRMDDAERRIATAIDTETTGLDIAAGERIRSISYAKGTIVDGVRESGTFILETEGRLSGPEAYRVHRIANDDPRQIPAREGMEQILAIVADGGEPGTGLVVMHNKKFDLGFIDDALKRAGLPPQRWEIEDTMEIALEQRPNRQVNLDALAGDVDGIDKALLRKREERHLSEDDCIITFELWRRIRRPLELGLERSGAEAKMATRQETGTPELDW